MTRERKISVALKEFLALVGDPALRLNPQQQKLLLAFAATQGGEDITKDIQMQTGIAKQDLATSEQLLKVLADLRNGFAGNNTTFAFAAQNNYIATAATAEDGSDQDSASSQASADHDEKVDRRNKYAPELKNRILEELRQGGSMSAIAKRENIPFVTINLWRKKANIPGVKSGGAKSKVAKKEPRFNGRYLEEQKAKAIEMLRAGTYSCSEIERVTGVKRGTLSVWKSTMKRGDNPPCTPEQEAQAKELLRSGGAKVSNLAIARECNIPAKFISIWRRELGIPGYIRAGVPTENYRYDDSIRNKALELLRQGKTIPEVSRQISVSITSLYNWALSWLDDGSLKELKRGKRGRKSDAAVAMVNKDIGVANDTAAAKDAEVAKGSEATKDTEVAKDAEDTNAAKDFDAAVDAEMAKGEVTSSATDSTADSDDKADDAKK